MKANDRPLVSLTRSQRAALECVKNYGDAGTCIAVGVSPWALYDLEDRRLVIAVGSSGYTLTDAGRAALEESR